MTIIKQKKLEKIGVDLVNAFVWRKAHFQLNFIKSWKSNLNTHHSRISVELSSPNKKYGQENPASSDLEEKNGDGANHYSHGRKDSAHNTRTSASADSNGFAISASASASASTGTNT